MRVRDLNIFAVLAAALLAAMLTVLLSFAWPPFTLDRHFVPNRVQFGYLQIAVPAGAGKDVGGRPQMEKIAGISGPYQISIGDLRPASAAGLAYAIRYEAGPWKMTLLLASNKQQKGATPSGYLGFQPAFEKNWLGSGSTIMIPGECGRQKTEHCDGWLAVTPELSKLRIAALLGVFLALLGGSSIVKRRLAARKLGAGKEK